MTNQYIVKEGETLSSIAYQRNLSPSRLQNINQLFPPILNPGDILNLEEPEKMLLEHHQIFVILSSNTIEYPGTITCYPDCFIYEQRQLSMNTYKLILKINIVSVISCQHFCHPAEDSIISLEEQKINPSDYPTHPGILIITYLSNPMDPQSVSAASFVAPNAELHCLWYHISSISKRRKNEIKFHPFYSVQMSNECNRQIMNDASKVPHERLSSASITKTLLKNLNHSPLLGKSTILDDVDVVGICSNLPMRFRNFKWKLLYNLSNDGTSYITLFEHSKFQKGPQILVIRVQNPQKHVDKSSKYPRITENIENNEKREKIQTIENFGESENKGEKNENYKNPNNKEYGRIGAYLSEGLKLQSRYYGGGETFVFRFNKGLEVFNWSRKNDSFITSTNEGLAIGTPNPAIWIDSRMRKGFTEDCLTFNSPPLCFSEFNVVEIELWSLQIL